MYGAKYKESTTDYNDIYSIDCTSVNCEWDINWTGNDTTTLIYCISRYNY